MNRSNLLTARAAHRLPLTVLLSCFALLAGRGVLADEPPKPVAVPKAEQ